MSSLPPVYVATVNIPGYLPMADEPACFDTAREAWGWLAGERERDEDSCASDESEYSDTVATLRHIASGEHEHGNPYEDWPTGAEGQGAVIGGTPGYDGDHDLGLVYSVRRVKHADYPHNPGRLIGCPACEARCHCDGESAECVYGGEHD